MSFPVRSEAEVPRALFDFAQILEHAVVHQLAGDVSRFLRNELFADLPGFRGGIVHQIFFQQFWISPFLHRDINRSPVRPAR